MPAEELAVLLNGAINFGVMWAGHGEKSRLARLKGAIKRLLTELRA
jgi:hypothetical protein